jgi:thiol-disulfide isomerase/thioredoxin
MYHQIYLFWKKKIFDELISTGRWLITFYAPWCPHCQKLEPILHEASIEIEKEKLGLRIGMVDCTVEKKLSERFSIPGFPILKYGYRGKLLDYTHGRELNHIIDFAKKLSGSAIKEITLESLDEFINSHLITFIYISNSNNVDIYIF